MAKERFRLKLSDEELKDILSIYVGMKYGFKSEKSTLEIGHSAIRNRIIFEGEKTIPDKYPRIESGVIFPEVLVTNATAPNPREYLSDPFPNADPIDINKSPRQKTK